MSQSHITASPPQFVESMRCPQCGVQMALARIEPKAPGVDQRTFECDQCGHDETTLVQFTESASAGGRIRHLE